MSHLPVAGLVLLVACGLALGRRSSRALAMVAAGVLHAAVVWVLPLREMPAVDAQRPVRIAVRLEEGWRPVRYGESVSGWVAKATVLRLQQGGWIGRGPDAVGVFVGGAEAPPGDRLLRLCGYLGRRQGFAHGGPAEPGPWRATVKSRGLVESLGPDRLLAASTALRRRLMGPLEAAARRGAQAGSSAGLGLASALLLGDRHRLDSGWRDGLRRLGLSHLLAVSGLHVALLLAPVLLLSRRAGPAAQLALAALTLVLYVLLVGPRPSLLRAAQMALLALGTRLVRRGREAANALAVASAVLVALEPSVVEDLGFQLTVAATAGIVVLVPWWGEVWPGPGAALRRSLQVSLAAQVATLPWLLSRFGMVSPFAPVANLLAVPWAGVCLLASIVVAASTALAPALAPAGLRLLDHLAAPFGWPALVAPDGPLGAAGLVLLVPLPVALACSLGLALALRRPARAACLAIALLLAWGLVAGRSSAESARLDLLDVGQGDAILLRDERVAVLVDGGGAAGGGVARRALLPALALSGVRSLDVGILSHPDRDHCRGLLELSRFVAVGEIWVPSSPMRGECVTELLSRFAGRTRFLAAGDAPQAGGWRFEVLHPERSRAGAGNASSLVLRAEHDAVGVLLAGDIDAAVEAKLVERYGGGLRSDILKVPHHGSRTSSSPRFLREVGARVALLSSGAGNPYGHPSPEVLARYRRRSTVLLRTDSHGRVTVSWSAGGPLRIRTTGR